MRRFYDRPQGAKEIMITGRGKSEDNNEMAIKMGMMSLTTTMAPPLTSPASFLGKTSPSSFAPLPPPPTSTEDDIMMMGSPIMSPFPPVEATTPMTNPMVSRKLRSP